ncbi:MAG: hypothetical protein CK424_06155 [Legionella sp.]|nr:MAG: hypothetical protein CK424_06155 [Legionella sp.]
MCVKTQMTPPHRAWYFLLCYCAYSAYTLDFVIRKAIQPQLMELYHLSAPELAAHYHMVYWGLVAGTILFGCLVNMLNFRTCFILIWVCQILGLVKLLALSPIILTTPMIHQFKSGIFLMGLAEGGIFALIHPLIALIFQVPGQSKVKFMAYLHTNWPLFTVIGVLFEQTIVHYHLDWYLNIYVILIFPCLYLVLALFLPLPSHSLKHHIPLSSRIKSTIRPGYFLLFFCMLFATTIENSPQVWIRNVIESHLQINGINSLFFLIYGSSLQFICRLFAGSITQRISPPALLCIASVLCVMSLYLLSISNQTTWSIIPAGIFAASIALYWPIYIAIIADRYPLSGGFGMGLMNSAGFLSMILTVPTVAKLSQLEGLSGAFLILTWYGILTLILLSAVYAFFRSQGGYKVFSYSERSL